MRKRRAVPEPKRFPFFSAAGAAREASSLPFLPLSLWLDAAAPLEAGGLLDTGASVNVLPFQTGRRLGVVWSASAPTVRLTGNLARFEAQALLVHARVADFAPVRLAFAWTRADEVPLVLGQVNFFMEFDACFFRSRGLFELRPKSAP